MGLPYFLKTKKKSRYSKVFDFQNHLPHALTDLNKFCLHIHSKEKKQPKFNSLVSSFLFFLIPYLVQHKVRPSLVIIMSRSVSLEQLKEILKNINVLSFFWGQFHHHFTSSFYARRTQKRKKGQSTHVAFCNFGICMHKSCS